MASCGQGDKGLVTELWLKPLALCSFVVWGGVLATDRVMAEFRGIPA